MATQGTDNLVIVDNMPSVEKLWNGRYRLEFFCKIQNPNEGWYSDSIDNWLPEFGTLQDADFAGEGWSARDGEAYPDMRLVKCEAKYIAPSETHLVTLTYETLTASWVSEKDEDIDYELNGLQRVSRTFVALPDTSYTKVVGTDTITVGGDTLTLGAFEIEKTDSIWSLTETWLEAGTLRVSSRNLSEGVQEVSTTFLVNEGTIVGPVVSRSTDNFEGLKTITVTTMQDGNGGSIIGTGERLANSYQQLYPFTYPGVADVVFRYLTGSGANYNSYQWSLTPPSQSLVASETFVIFQDTSDIQASDYTYDGASGLWNPNQWASGQTYGIGFNYTPFAESKGFRGYRAKYIYDYNFTEGNNPSGPNYLINGNRIFAGNKCGISLSGGPENPEGNKYTLEVKITPAFEDISGVTSYKKVIVVSTIPTQVSNVPPAPVQ